MKILKYLIIISIALSSCSVKKKTTQEFLLNETSKEKGVAEPSIKVYLKVDTLQKLSKDGIRFTVKVRNDSSANININNLLDFSNIGLLVMPVKYGDEEIILGYVTRGRSHSENYKVDLSRSSLRIKDVLMGGKRTHKNILEEKKVMIPSKSEYEVIFSIPKILRPKPTKPYDIDQLITIPEGRYRLFFSQTIGIDERYIESLLKKVTINYAKF